MSLLASIQEQLQHVDELVANLEKTTILHPRPSLAANIRSLEKERRVLQEEFDRAAMEAEVDVYRYRIINKDRATITGLTDAWREFQSLLSVVYDSLTKGGAKKKKQAAQEATSIELGFGYSFPGSVGVALTLPNRSGLFTDEAIAQATDIIFELAQSYGDPSKVSTMARRLGPAPVAAMYRWAHTHVVNRYGVGLEWQRSPTEVRRMLIQFEELQVLQDELSRTTIESHEDFTGDLVAVDTDAKTFRMRQDDGTEVAGTYEEAITREQAARLPARYSARITKFTKVIISEGGPEQISYFLDTLNPLP
jgi:hypothetical protein